MRIHQLDRVSGTYGLGVVTIDGAPHLLAGAIDDDDRLRIYDPRTPDAGGRVIGSARGTIDIAPHDFDRDGADEVAIASGFCRVTMPDGSRHVDASGTWVHWMRTAGPEAWTSQRIVELPWLHRITWADVDGDGRKELIAATLRGARGPLPTPADFPPPFISGRCEGPWAEGGAVYAFKPPAQPGGAWTHDVLVSGLRLNHGLHVGDLDGDGIDELFVGSSSGIHWLKPPQAGTTHGITKLGDSEASEVAVGVFGATRVLMAVEPWHGNQLVCYAPRGDAWERRVVSDDLVVGHSLCCGDFDGDGRVEVVVGELGRKRLWLYRGGPETFARTELDPDMGPGFAVAADLHRRGRLDLVCSGLSTGNLTWYELP